MPFVYPKKKFGTWKNKVLGGAVEVNIISFKPLEVGIQHDTNPITSYNYSCVDNVTSIYPLLIGTAQVSQQSCRVCDELTARNTHQRNLGEETTYRQNHKGLNPLQTEVG